jgi:predicted RNase H-like HicB family nuclease
LAKIIGMELQLTAVFEELPKSEGGGYLAFCQEIPGAITQGETLAEARENLKDAIQLMLEVMREESEKQFTGHRIIREQITVPA